MHSHLHKYGRNLQFKKVIKLSIFIDYEEFQLQTTQRSKTDLFLDVPIVNRDLLFNPNCYIGIIIDYLIEEVGIPKDLKGKVNSR